MGSKQTARNHATRSCIGEVIDVRAAAFAQTKLLALECWLCTTSLDVIVTSLMYDIAEH